MTWCHGVDDTLSTELLDSLEIILFSFMITSNGILRILKDKHNCSPLFYYRFVDDTILCVQKKFIDLVLNIFNSQELATHLWSSTK